MEATQAFKTMLEVCGYTNVSIEEITAPKHVVDWARGDDEELTDEETAETMPYFTVISDQGSFGIVMGAYMLLDVKNTGFNALDLGEEDAKEDFFLASLNQPALIHLRRLMTKKSKNHKIN
ncbi:MAG: hypothetical protein A3B91_04280 [Candidatus Yanofskybacteria bacterium RIFCSPHIGHO2_02_FULL_41_29]|uniref:Uncharacterized protein n=1 Tax=Candidatus Yanofskybacteria bacterium RIFCSPHIGHO2_01_FULL_41_53 TaxID=1802663 RepID=A0A1F8EHY7_9BACT|nr:MAG: hypothetical protein A2650_03540 [Candidatus Yanofskybacteria bacterium RIFCSPHIGHO2_01_FULL_41_53]OGN11741.1 MAG: hypothetical protein A3B91_04280 [Candidatus Yanofskybacteria bacterium RIFCSPHIGHO2_02_FULL_41_29]OGN17506.1 MAG: hypothetical protein A3F48_01840 [Candidatus Yanofskybacteria bacterium RIFCSPHIGHO2_12_FULL_41_9]OGN22895.1 MAG: hypothetical protein A2916_00735 [Candidatus Yanofskybacteria bacterium RIFCSPLOWO2_01_FULL_41_67]OGN30277.1 MAG: hypothetical protein A3H54_05135 